MSKHYPTLECLCQKNKRYAIHLIKDTDFVMYCYGWSDTYRKVPANEAVKCIAFNAVGASVRRDPDDGTLYVHAMPKDQYEATKYHYQFYPKHCKKKGDASSCPN